MATKDLGTVLTLTAQGAGTVAAVKNNKDGRGIRIAIDLSAKSGTPTLTVTLSGISANGKKRTILASAALSAVATTYLTVFPGAAVTANASANDQLDAQFEISATVAGTTPSITATIAACILA